MEIWKVYHHHYGDEFYNSLEAGGRRSAQKIVKFVLTHLSISSVLDVGCGRGIWLDEWHYAGVNDAHGIDGDYIDTARMAVSAKYFTACDLSQPFRLGRRFDLVQSLEVAEHIFPDRTEIFIDNLVAHGDVILFSAAVPGQGGEFHVNEQPYEYWRIKFAARGYQIFDFIRPNIITALEVDPWYRYNTFLYIKGDAIHRISSLVAQSQVNEGENIVNVAPLLWKVRNDILRHLPQPLVEYMIKKKNVFTRAAKKSTSRK
jgi:SAM-dependent methyltransferase